MEAVNNKYQQNIKQEGELVVDPCAGSFVVLDACQQTGRNFLGCDLTLADLTEHKENLLLEAERAKQLNSPISEPSQELANHESTSDK